MSEKAFICFHEVLFPAVYIFINVLAVRCEGAVEKSANTLSKFKMCPFLK